MKRFLSYCLFPIWIALLIVSAIASVILVTTLTLAMLLYKDKPMILH